MYRVNFYHDKELRGSQTRRQMVRSSLVGILVGVELILIALLVVSGRMLDERNQGLRHAVASLESQAVIETAGEADDVKVARSLVRMRNTRLDWLPLLRAVSEIIPDSVILTRIEAGVGLDNGERSGVNLEGHLGTGAGQMEDVLEFVDALRTDATVSREFPAIDLDTVETDGAREFRIICRKEAAKKS